VDFGVPWKCDASTTSRLISCRRHLIPCRDPQLRGTAWTALSSEANRLVSPARSTLTSYQFAHAGHAAEAATAVQGVVWPANRAP
jgi:hypothetical protein